MLCHRQEDSRGGGCGPPARVAVPRSTPVGSPLQAAGDKPQKARTENKQKPCSHKFWFDRLGRWGAARRVPERNSPEQSGGGGVGVSYSRWHKVPRSVPPIKRPFPSLQKNYSCKHPDDRKMGLEQQSNSACPLCSGGDGDVAQCLNTQYRDLLISGEIKYTQHEQSPKWSWARPHTAVFVCGGTGCSSQRHHLSGRFPFQAIEQWGKLKIDRSAELYICFARRYGLAFANRPFSTLGAPGEAGTHGQAPEHEASAGPGQGKSHPLPDLPSHPRTAQREKSEVGSTSAWE